MNGPNFDLLVGGFIVGTFVVWILFDLWLTKNGAVTESRWIADSSHKSTFWTFMVGFLTGHWFLYQDHISASGWVYGLGIWVVLVAWDVWWNLKKKSERVWYRSPWVWFPSGAIAGSFLWGQSW